ncbi:hypothetical protein F3K53_17165 [Pseudomonas veronii]|uniref:Uncharacterized protein n=1 Tax=Pseudomonas veronii TaxID=76761 RepID=A0A5M8EX67_PSEVE|nr:hypothetical protein F3K53_17165 [Pseudomonas veronii]KAA6178742.1 hypothetical protein F3K54_09520 [Pseudomonas veronii]PMX90269.1 hypothetical protein C1Y21_17155 [Pseudomonas sp. MPR-R2A3]
MFFRLATATAHRRLPPHNESPVGASLLAKNPRATRSSRMPALSLTLFASTLAPTPFMYINP